MRFPFFALLHVAALQGLGDPRALVRESALAVERGTEAVIRRSWLARVRRDSLDAAGQFGLATLARLSYDYAGAETRYARGAAMPPERAGRFPAFAVLGLAQGRFTTGRYAEASADFDQARQLARAGRDSSAEALALIGLGWLRLRSGDPARARAVLDTAATLVGPRDLELRAALACGRAAVLVRTSRARAAAEGRAGATLARRAGDPRLEANCLNGVANSLAQSGQLPAAARALADVAGHLRRLRDRAGLASALQWAGFVALSRDRFDEAQRLLGQAILEAEASGNRSALAWSLLDLARVSIVFADPASARAQTDRALEEMRAIGDDWGVTNALGFDGQLADLAGDTARARNVYAELASRATAEGDASLEAEMATRLASLATRERAWEDAERLLDRARAALARASRPAATVAQPYERGVLALRRGDLPQARILLSNVLEAALDSAPQIAPYLAGVRLAETVLGQGDTTRAEALLGRAEERLDRWRAGLSDSTLRVLAFQVLDEFGGPGLGSATVINAVAARGRVAQALALVERERARDLRDQLIRATAARATAPTPRPGPSSLAFDVADLQAALPDSGTALLEYATGRGAEPTTLFVITRAGIRALTLPPLDSLLPSVERFIAAIQGSAPDSTLGDRLGTSLLGPAAAALGPAVTRLVLVPDDALHRVPFPALRLHGRYLVERYALAQAPSAAVAADIWRRPPHAGPRRVLAFGDPAFPHDDPALPPATRAHFAAFAQRGGLPPLPASAAEARAAGSLFPGSDVRLGRAASEAALRRLRLDGFSIIHLATHALVDEAALGRSAIVLAPGGGEDGFVTSGDLAQLKLDADVVVLSGCGTALGVIVGGEGIRGLTTPLLEAGARAVVGTLWPIGDASAAAFVASFYRALGRGQTTVDALRSAQLERIAQDAGPRSWAGFEIVGNGMLTPGAGPAGRPLSAR
jgi:tetratricopeptide (TPR) repeat protein